MIRAMTLRDANDRVNGLTLFKAKIVLYAMISLMLWPFFVYEHGSTLISASELELIQPFYFYALTFLQQKNSMSGPYRDLASVISDHLKSWLCPVKMEKKCPSEEPSSKGSGMSASVTEATDHKTHKQSAVNCLSSTSESKSSGLLLFYH